MRPIDFKEAGWLLLIVAMGLFGIFSEVRP